MFLRLCSSSFMFAQTHKSVQHKKLPIAKLSFEGSVKQSRANGNKTSSLDPVLVKTAQKQTMSGWSTSNHLLRPDAHKLITIH